MNQQKRDVISARCGKSHELINQLRIERLTCNEYTMLIESNQDISKLLEEVERLTEERDMWKNQADALKIIAMMPDS